MHILLAGDGSTHAQAAVEMLKRLPFPPDTRITVLSVAYAEDSVARSMFFSPESGADRAYELTADEEVRAAVRRIEVASSQLQPRCHEIQGMVRFGHFADEILRAVRETRADLLVVGSRGLGTFKSWLLGSVSHAMVSAASCSVLVARAARQPESAGLRILLATDGSTDAAAAAELLASWHLDACSTVAVLTAVYHLMPAGFDLALPRESDTDDVQMAREFADSVADALQPHGARVETIVREGAPADTIVDVATAWGADLVVVGTKGRSAIEAFLIGSVSHKVATYAPCSVLIVRKTT